MGILRVSLLVVANVILISCGGGGSGATDNTKTGSFIDSPVEGLTYSTDTQSGLTNAAGEFKYIEGEVVTFKVGNVNIGSAFGAEIVTPLDITNTFLPSEEAASNVVRFLQTLDDDADPSNGIKLPVSVAALSANLDINDIAAVEAAIQTTLIDSATAEAHFDSVLQALPVASVEGTYQQLAIGKNPVAGCPNIIDTVITVSSDTAGDNVYQGEITLSGGGVYQFTEDDAGIRSPTVADDLLHTYRLTLGLYGGTMTVHKNNDLSIYGRCAEVKLTTDHVTNFPPIVSRPLHVIGICSGSASTYDLGMYIGAHDKDGYLINDLDFQFAIDGGELQSMVHTPPSCTGTCGEQLALAAAWSPGAPSRSNRHFATANPAMENIPCTSGFRWEATATDNKGLTTTLKGGSDAPFAPVTGTSGKYYTCSENYPEAACDILISGEFGSIGTTTKHPVGSCAALTPEPRSIISENEIAPTTSVENLIINFTPFGESVSCLIELDIPTI